MKSTCITNNSSPLIMQPFVYDDGIEFSDETLQKNLHIKKINEK